MKIEFVEFYKYDGKRFNKSTRKILGTVHVYLIEEELDIRGINAIDTGKGIFFFFPHFYAIDEDTKEIVKYPYMRFVNDNKHKALMDFLHQEVKPIIRERLLVKSE